MTATVTVSVPVTVTEAGANALENFERAAGASVAAAVPAAAHCRCFGIRRHPRDTGIEAPPVRRHGHLRLFMNGDFK